MKGSIGETHNIGGNNEKSNIDVVRSICSLLEEFYLINQNILINMKI